MRSPTSVLIFLAVLHQVIILQYANAQDYQLVDEDGQIIRQDGHHVRYDGPNVRYDGPNIRHDGPMTQKYMYPPIHAQRTETRQGTQKLTNKKCQNNKHKLLPKYVQRPRQEPAYLQVNHSAPSKFDKMSELLQKLSDFMTKLKQIWKMVVTVFKSVFGMIFN